MTKDDFDGGTPDTPLAEPSPIDDAFDALSKSMKNAGVHPSQLDPFHLSKYGNPPVGSTGWSEDGQPMRWVYSNRHK